MILEIITAYILFNLLMITSKLLNKFFIQNLRAKKKIERLKKAYRRLNEKDEKQEFLLKNGLSAYANKPKYM